MIKINSNVIFFLDSLFYKAVHSILLEYTGLTLVYKAGDLDYSEVTWICASVVTKYLSQ